MSVCVGCKTPIEVGAAYCPRCGTPNPDAPTFQTPTGSGTTTEIATDDLGARLQRALGRDYRVGGLLGEGGFALVFEAQDRKLSRRVAIKVLRPELTGSSTTVRRFVREAESAASLNHPHILPIFFVGEGEGLVYFGMPLVEGETLEGRIAREGQLPEADVARIGADVADALAEAHAAGLVHRDIKPANVLLQGPKHRVLVADFGIAKAVSAKGGSLTGTGVTIGSPHYMSPEQAGGAGAIDHRSDVYSLGVMLWQMLAGAVPFDGPDTQSILVQHLTQPLPRLRTLRGDVTPGLVAIVERCCAKKPDQRFQDSGELATALRSISATSAVPAPADRPWSRRTPIVVGVAGAATVVAVWLVATGKPAPPRPGSAQAGALLPDSARSTAPLVAVLPFDVNLAGDSAQLARQTARSLTNTIGTRYQVATVDVNRLMGRWAAERRTLQAPLDTNAAFAYSLGANQLIMGAAFASGQQTRLTVDIYDTRSLDRIGHSEIDGNTDSLISLLDRLAGSVAEAFCRQPGFNPGNLCYDTPARPVAMPPLALRGPVPAESPTFEVLVNRAGALADVRIGAGVDATVAAAALPILRKARYEPARRIGVAVDAWTSVTMVAQQAADVPATPAAEAGSPSDCASPTVSISNPNGSCWDNRPVPRVIPRVVRPAECGRGVTSASVLVHVSAAGEVIGRPVISRRSSCAMFSQVAVAFALDVTFEPATLRGRGVDAWTVLAVQAIEPGKDVSP